MVNKKKDRKYKNVKKVRKEIKSPKIETEEKILTEEESLEWLVDGINKTIRTRIKAFFDADPTRLVEDYQLSIDNNDGKVVLLFIKDGEIAHTESFKA